MARLTFPSRLELNRPEGSFNAAPLGNVILTTFLYVSPVQTMPPWEKTGVPIHFHSSTISGSASCMIPRTFASVFPRQSASSLIFWSMNAEADSTGTGLFIYSSSLTPIFAAHSVICNFRKWKALLVRLQFGRMVVVNFRVADEPLAICKRHGVTEEISLSFLRAGQARILLV